MNIQTVRFYERRGILPKPTRTASGYRVYSAEAVRLIRFIKRAQELGFTLDEIEDLLRLRNNRRSSCADVLAPGGRRGASDQAAEERRIEGGSCSVDLEPLAKCRHRNLARLRPLHSAMATSRTSPRGACD